MQKLPSDGYLDKARKLTRTETERLLSRSRNKLMRRVLDKKLTRLEAVAIQLEIEDEALAEWRSRMADLKKKELEKVARANKD